SARKEGFNEVKNGEKEAKAINDFDLLLLETIDETLSSLGERLRNAIYHHLEQQFSLPREEIPSRIEEFQDALEKLCGIGARHLEVTSIRILHAKLKSRNCTDVTDLGGNELTFQGYIERKRQDFEKANQTITFTLIPEEEKQQTTSRKAPKRH
ncbi:MAG: hypothetical protein ACE14S_09995, partial [Candidatus Bathyarchaeia archaeon]